MKTDNTKKFLNNKIQLRIICADKFEHAKVLDCFSGKGTLWKEVKKKIPSIVVHQIEILKNKNSNAITADSARMLRTLDLSKYDIIDLEAYGCPFDHLEVIRKRKYDGIVIVTSISSMQSSVQGKLVRASVRGDADPYFFKGMQRELLLGWLDRNGVSRVFGTLNGDQPHVKDYFAFSFA